MISAPTTDISWVYFSLELFKAVSRVNDTYTKFFVKENKSTKICYRIPNQWLLNGDIEDTNHDNYPSPM